MSKRLYNLIIKKNNYKLLTLLAATPQNGRTHSNNLSATADELFECVGPFCGVGA